MRRQAVAPTACRSCFTTRRCERTTVGRGIAGDADLERAGAPRCRRLAQPRLRRRAAAEPRRRSPRFCLRNGYALEHRDQADARARARDRPRRRARGRARSGRRRRSAAAAQLVPARRAATARATPRRSCRARCCSTRCASGWLDEAQALGCVAVVTALRADGRRAARAAARAPACAALVYTVNDPAEAQRLVALGIDGIITDAVDRFSPGAASPTGRRVTLARRPIGSSAPRTRA